MPADQTVAHPARILDGATETDHLRGALAAAQADLGLHVAALSRLQDELMASRLEVAGARGESAHVRGYLRQLQADVESAHAHIGELNAHIAKLAARAAEREAECQAIVAKLRAEVAAFRASFSWRVTKPVRAAVRTLRWCRRAMRLGGRPVPAQSHADAATLPPPASPDPNAPYLFKPAPFPDTGQGTVTVEELHSLSRSA